MKLRHATPEWNLESIFQQGLDPLYAVTEADKHYVWFHTKERTPWAINHTVRRKAVSEDQVIILEVSVPRSWLERAWKGIWKCSTVVPPERIRVLDLSCDLESEGVTA